MRLFLLALLFISCGKQASVQTNSSATQSVLESCKVMAGTADPRSIDEFIVLLNSMPKPVSLDCLVKSLRRPLYINATSSTMSVQPAVSNKTPRIFIFKGNLIISIVPAGEGSEVVEFSELKGDTRSIKGELALPITGDLAGSEPYRKILSTDRTSCSGCHSGERLESTKEGVAVYSSAALRPAPSKHVPLSILENEHYLCGFNKDYSKRCAVYRALFSYGDVEEKSFPSAMPTFLNSF